MKRARTDAATTDAVSQQHWFGAPRCPVCDGKWDVNTSAPLLFCCCRHICNSCWEKTRDRHPPCPLCEADNSMNAESKVKFMENSLARLRGHVQNENPVAVRELGNCYSHGYLDVYQCDTTAAILLQRAADLGDIEAMHRLGYVYDKGLGVKVDKKKALDYHRDAADRGHANAQFNVGICLEQGFGTARDDVEAARFHALAAEQGFAAAEDNLARMYDVGRGVAVDMEKSLALRRSANRHRRESGASPWESP